MPQKSGFFDTTVDDPREYPAREFAEYFARFIGNGVFGGGDKLKVMATGKDMNVSVILGYGWINGYLYNVYDAPLILPIQQATTQDRIDRIVLRLDTSTPVRSIRAIVLQGNPATSPIPPTLVRSGNIYDLSLAQVLVKANTSTIQPHQVTDERLNNQVCGVVTSLITQADTTSLFHEFQSWLHTKTADYQKQWSDFLQGVKNTGFATPQEVDVKINERVKQKHPLCKEDGTTIQIHSKDLNTLVATGYYNGNNMIHAPIGYKSGYIDVVVVSADDVSQVYQPYDTNQVYVRKKFQGTWTQWERIVTEKDIEAVKQSGVDLRRRFAGAINVKGVLASARDDFTTLVGKIGQIQTGGRMDVDKHIENQFYLYAVFPPGTRNIVFANLGGSRLTYNKYGEYSLEDTDGGKSELRIMDESRASKALINGKDLGWGLDIESMYIDIAQKQVTTRAAGSIYEGAVRSVVKSLDGLDLSGPIQIEGIARTYRTTETARVYLKGTFIYS